MSNDGIKWWPKIKVIKYDPDTVAQITKRLGHEPTGPELRMLERTGGLVPDDIVHAEGNQLVDLGLKRLADLIVGGSSTAFNASQAIIGVGATSTAWATTQSALAGNGSTTTAYYQGADAAPTSSTSSPYGVISANATFTALNANFAWNEWCWAIGTGTITPGGTLASVATSPVMLNRKVQSLGTKVSGAVWTLQATVTLT